jgi:late competence protein required for DNA uptake (superfamily II DNA/RNA helicase)
MRLEIRQKGGQVLVLAKNERLRCVKCGSIEANQWYYCGELKTIYCDKCEVVKGAFKGNIIPCGRHTNHTHYLVNKVERENQ